MTSTHQSQELQENRRLVLWGLVALLLCSSFFAFYNSNTAYTSDEVWSLQAASLNFRSEIATLKADVHPPLYFLILHSWLRLFGTGERAVRSLSGLFYMLGVFALFGLARELYGTKTGLLCAAIYLSSPLAILAAQFARMYSLLSLLSILSTWLYLQFSIKRRDSRLLFVLYIVVNALGTFTHIAFFFLLFGQIVVHLLFYRHLRMKRFVVVIVLSMVPYLFLWGSALLAQIINSGEGTAWVKKPGLSMLGDLLFNYGGAFWLVLPVLVYVRWKDRSHSSGNAGKPRLTNLPLWLLVITILTPILISEVKPIFNSRLAIIGVHLFALSIGRFTGKGATYLLPLAIVALTIAFITVVHPESAPCDNRQMAVYLSQTAGDGDVVIFTSLTRLPIDYYLQQAPTRKRLFETSFPAEIDHHPGYEGSVRNPARRAVLESEAKLLVDKIGKMQMRRIFFFHGFHSEVDSILEQRLREQFELISGEGVQCGEVSPYFKEVSVYR
ncbi:MAG TPA: glycosyltransferase family 39 protein [Pyrinomonadaceae bacterium]|nr:glycosyltransferase family 39 protein [Pyrinomonadaceae bacterium]